MEKRFRDYTEVQLRGAFAEVGLEGKDIDKAIADYMAYRERELNALIGPSSIRQIDPETFADDVMNNWKDGLDLFNSIADHYVRYGNYKQEIAEAYQDSKSWDTAITKMYNDINESQEAFTDYVEEIYQTKVEDAEHLQKLTGLALEGLEEIITAARFSKYSRALETTLQAGAKYEDLLKITPMEFGLPETWNGTLATDQRTSILWCIEAVFQIGEPNSTLRADLKAIAKEIEAPYSVLLDVHKISHQWKLQS